MIRARSPQQRRAVAVGVLGTMLVAVYAVWAGVQILWLNPLAAVPGRTLVEIYGDLSSAGESFSISGVIATLSIGPVVAVGLLVLTITRHVSDPWLTAPPYVGLLVLGAGGYFMASFLPGMSLADAYGIGGGDHSPWARPLYLTSLLAVVALIVMAAVRVRTALVAAARSTPIASRGRG